MPKPSGGCGDSARLRQVQAEKNGSSGESRDHALDTRQPARGRARCRRLSCSSGLQTRYLRGPALVEGGDLEGARGRRLSASIDDRLICTSVPWPLVAAAKALLAEGHAPEAEIAMRHRGSTIVAMRGQIGTLAALTDEAATPGGPSPPQTGSQDGDLDDEGVHPT